MVRFVNDDGLEIRHQAGEPGAATQGLHTGHHRGGGMLIARRLHDAEGQGGIDEVQFVHGLLDELIAVRQDQGPPAAPLHQEGKDNRFARPGGQDEQGPLHPARGGGEQGRDRFVLVGARRQAHHGWRGDSSHRVAPPEGMERGAAAHGVVRPRSSCDKCALCQAVLQRLCPIVGSQEQRPEHVR